MKTSVAVAFARAVAPGRALNLMIEWTTMVTDAAKAAADAMVPAAAVATATMCSRDNSFSARWCRCASRTALASSSQMQPRDCLGLVRSRYCRRRRPPPPPAPPPRARVHARAHVPSLRALWRASGSTHRLSPHWRSPHWRRVTHRHLLPLCDEPQPRHVDGPDLRGHAGRVPRGRGP